MGAFFIIGRRTGEDHDARVAAMRESLTLQGFAAPTLFQGAYGTVAVFPKQEAGDTNCHCGENGDFAFATGTLFYKGLYGASALRRIVSEADEEGFDPQALRGAFCLVIAKPDSLRLLTDAMGTYRVYRSSDWSVISSSFLATLASCSKPAFDTQGVYQYVFNGATFGTRTPVAEIGQLGHAEDVLIDGTVQEHRYSTPVVSGFERRTFSDHIDANISALRDWFSQLTSQFPGRIDAALSGGYDSRLILALLRAQNEKPRLHVYGPPGDSDVRIATAIADGEGFSLYHIDKAMFAADAASTAERVQKNFRAFDGLPTDGIFDTGADLATRRARAAGRFLQLNGGGGEIFRNFHYLPDRSYSVEEFLWSFYSQFDPAACTDRFRSDEYYQALRTAVEHCLGRSGDRLSRWEIELLYPYFRCSYWTGRNTSLNNRFGPMLTPFVERTTVAAAVKVPLADKQHGRFEAALIAAIDPRLARYPSAYGHDFASPPSYWRRVTDQMSLQRPASLRRFAFRIKTRMRPAVRPQSLAHETLAKVADPAMPMMSRFFLIDAVRDNAQFARLCTLEYLSQHCSVGDAGQAR